MRLVSCHVTGFGQLKEFYSDFSEGLNAFCEDNGWGKSTLSAFIEAMFYGVEKKIGKKRYFNVRKQYKPWDQGAYGGNLVFEVAGKPYRIERTFGDTEKTDTFKLIDVMTGMESTDYTENIGEELFEVDRDSFEKTIYVPQLVAKTAMTDSMSAKMGDIASAKDDINNFDSAIDRIKDAKKIFKKQNKTEPGSIGVCKREIRRLREIIDKKGPLYDGYQKQLDVLNDKKRQRNWMEVKKSQMTELIRKKSKYEQDMGAIKQKREFLSEQSQQLENLDDFFSKGIPEIYEQESMEEIESQWELGKRKEAELTMKLPTEQQIHKWETLFEKGTPSAADFEEWNKQAQRMQELRLQGEHVKLSEDSKKQLEDLEHFFAHKIPTDVEISNVVTDVQNLSILEGKIVQQDETYRNLKARRDVVLQDEQGSNSRGKVVLFSILAIIFALGGAVIYAFRIDWIVLEIIFDVCAASCLVSALMIGIRIRSSRNNRKDDLESQLLEAKDALTKSREEETELKTQIQEFLSNFRLTPTESFSQMVFEIQSNLDVYYRLLEEDKVATSASTELGEEMANLQMRLYTTLASFSEVYEMDLYHESNETELLAQLAKDAKDYAVYLEDKRNVEHEHKNRQEREHLLESYFGRFPFDETLEPKKKLLLIRTNLGNYTRLQDSVTSLRGDLEEIEQQLPQQADETDAMTIEECQHKQEECEIKIAELNRAILECETSLAEFAAQLDEVEEAERTLEGEEEHLKELEKSYELLELTEQYLKSAKQRFLAEYLAPLRERMDYYLGLLDKQVAEETKQFIYEMDLDLSVRVIESGTSHDSEYLSCGYRDLVALCARFALMDVLYHHEQPMIILDDPFTNFDRDTIARAISLLRQFGEQRQIIYFTCHDSRMP